MGNTVTASSSGNTSPTTSTTPNSNQQFSSFFTLQNSSSPSKLSLSHPPHGNTTASTSKIPTQAHSSSSSNNTTTNTLPTAPSTNTSIASDLVTVFYNPNNAQVFTVFRNSVQVYDPRDDHRKITVYALPLIQNVLINCATFLEDEDLLITGDSDGKIRIYQASSGTFVRAIPDDSSNSLPAEEERDSNNSKSVSSSDKSYERGEIKCILVMDDANQIAIGSDKMVEIYSRISGSLVLSIPTEAEFRLTCLAYDKMRKFLYCGCSDGFTRVCSVEKLETGSYIMQFKGHSAAVISLVIATESDALVSISEDNTIRAWNLDTGKELCGYKLNGACLAYDEHRDLLFCGTSDGIFSIARLSSNISNSLAEIQVLQKMQAYKVSLSSLWYHSKSDSLVTCAEGQLGEYWETVTGISCHEAKKVEDLSETKMQLLLKDFTAEQTLLTISPRLEAEQKLLDLCMKLLDDDTESSKTRKDSLLADFGSILVRLKSSFNTIQNEATSEKHDLAQRYSAALNLDLGIQQLEERLANEERELKERWEREWAAFRARSELQRKAFHDHVRVSRRQVASRIATLNKKVEQRKQELESEASHSLRKLLNNSFPIINDTYQIGNPISSGSVFKGLDLNSMEFVAIKVFPSTVSLDTSLKHEGLVPVLDICTPEGENTTFVIMKMMKETLSAYVLRQHEQCLPLTRVAKLMNSILKSIAYLHSKRMVVRDLKPQHLLMNQDEHPCIQHLGVMRSLQGTVESEVAEDGAVYSAPEIFCRVVKGSSDMWSLGCVFLYLLQTPSERENPLFCGQDEKTVLKSMIKIVGKPNADDLKRMGEHCKMDEDGIDLLNYVSELQEETVSSSHMKQLCSRASPAALDLLSKMLVFVPDKRISAVDALHHGYFVKEHSLHIPPECDLLPHTDLTLTSTVSESNITDTSDLSDDEDPQDAPDFK